MIEITTTVTIKLPNGETLRERAAVKIGNKHLRNANLLAFYVMTQGQKCNGALAVRVKQRVSSKKRSPK